MPVSPWQLDVVGWQGECARSEREAQLAAVALVSITSLLEVRRKVTMLPSREPAGSLFNLASSAWQVQANDQHMLQQGLCKVAKRSV